jgi:heptosyltransferase-2
MKIIIVVPNWVGDTVLVQSLVAELRAADPTSIIHLLAPPWTAPLGERMDGVAHTRVFIGHHGRLSFWKRVKEGISLRGFGYDLAIVLPNSLKAAIAPFFAGIPLRRGYVGEWRYGLLNDVRSRHTGPLVRTVDRFVALAHDEGRSGIRTSHPRLQHAPGLAHAAALRLGLSLAQPVIALCPGAEYGPSKQWPASHFAELARLLSRRGLAVWLFGSAKDRRIATDIERMTSDLPTAPANLCGATTLLEALDLLGLSSGVVSNDSGLMHVAAAIGRPVVALFGSTSPTETPPLTRKARVLERSLPCRPCFERTCSLQHGNCLRSITPQEVAAAIEEIREPPVDGGRQTA